MSKFKVILEQFKQVFYVCFYSGTQYIENSLLLLKGWWKRECTFADLCTSGVYSSETQVRSCLQVNVWVLNVAVLPRFMQMKFWLIATEPNQTILLVFDCLLLVVCGIFLCFVLFLTVLTFEPLLFQHICDHPH